MGSSPYHHPMPYPPGVLDSTPDHAQPLPVVIVGAGPVGMTLAVALAARQVPVVLLEASDRVSFGSRAICISRHSVEVADRLGFAEPIEARALPWVGGMSYFRNTEVLRFRMPMGEHDVRAPMANIGQSELEEMMVERVAAEPLVQLVWQAAVTGVRTDPSGGPVTLQVQTAAGPRTLRAAWVVAADGGRSTVRELVGLRLNGTSYQGRYVIADIHWPSNQPVERRVWFDPPSNPGSTVIMHRQPADIWRIDYQIDTDEDPAEQAEERIRERITQHLDWLESDVPWTLEWHGGYTANALALDHFVHDRVVFAGDSAHLVPIFGVRGMNSGLEDAETLAWMLAAVVQGRAEPALLDAYAVERRSAWEQNVANAAKSTRIMTPGSDGYRATRDAILRLAPEHPAYSVLLNPRQSSATHAHTSPLTWHAAPDARGTLPGDPVPDWRLTDSEPVRTLNHLRGNGFGLLAFGFDEIGYAGLAELESMLAEALAPEPCQLVLVNPSGSASTPPTHPVAIDPTLQQALGAVPGEVFVVRPDGLLLARVSNPEDLKQLPDSLRAGRAPEGGRMAPDWPDPTAPAERHLEHLWESLSEAIDRTPPEQRQGLLVRLSLLLGAQVPVGRFTSAVRSALSVNDSPNQAAKEIR